MAHSSGRQWCEKFRKAREEYLERKALLEQEIQISNQQKEQTLKRAAEIQKGIETLKQAVSELAKPLNKDVTIPKTLARVAREAEVKHRKFEALKGVSYVLELAENAVFAAKQQDFEEATEVFLTLKARKAEVPETSPVGRVVALIFAPLASELKTSAGERLTSELAKFSYGFTSEVPVNDKADISKLLEPAQCLLAVDENALLTDLIRPIDAKFAFHFTTETKTNTYEKPEWYLNYILDVIRKHGDFWGRIAKDLTKWSESKKLPISGDFEEKLISKVLDLALVKMKKDLPALMNDVVLFSHLIDEVIMFTEELRKVDLVLVSSHLEHLAENEDSLRMWLSIELSCVSEEIQTLLGGTDAWTVGAEQVPSFCERYLLLINGMVRRYSLIRSEESRLKFFGLQNKLIDDLRVRLLQLIDQVDSAWNPKYLAVANAGTFIAETLKTWDSTPFYAQMQALSARMKETTGRGVPQAEGLFDTHITLYSGMVTDMLDGLVDDVLLPELRRSLEPYSCKKWHAVQPSYQEGSESPNYVTEEYMPFLVKMQERLAFIREHSSLKLAGRFARVFCPRLAAQYKNFVFGLNFNVSGAAQFASDFELGVIPLLQVFFSQSSLKLSPWVFFVELRQILLLLKSASGSLLLLSESVNSPNSVTVLSDFGVPNLSGEVVTDVCRLRVDCAT